VGILIIIPSIPNIELELCFVKITKCIRCFAYCLRENTVNRELLLHKTEEPKPVANHRRYGKKSRRVPAKDKVPACKLMKKLAKNQINDIESTKIP